MAYRFNAGNLRNLFCRVAGHPSRWRDRMGLAGGAVVIARLSIIALCLLACGGCGATITVNVLSSHSRYGQAIGGTNTTIKGHSDGGGSLTATVPTAP
jgi:hypothetical protein